MYSRYTPNESGGFDRRWVPDGPHQPNDPSAPLPSQSGSEANPEFSEASSSSRPTQFPGGPGPPPRVPNQRPNVPQNGPFPPPNQRPNVPQNGPFPLPNQRPNVPQNGPFPPPNQRPHGPQNGPFPPPNQRPHGPQNGPFPPPRPAPGPFMGRPTNMPPGFGGIFGPGGLIGRFLPRGLETEDLLVLAVLLLAMKQDGSDKLELMIAAALYLLL